MKFGWLTLALSPSPEEDAQRIDDQIAQVCLAEELAGGSGRHCYRLATHSAVGGKSGRGRVRHTAVGYCPV